MIELPEACTIARQLSETVTGKRIIAADVNATPHKWAFYKGDPAGSTARLVGKTLGAASGHGSNILVPVGSELVLLLGGGGERILYHRNLCGLPKKHQLLLRFADEAALTVTVQGWGSVYLMTWQELKSGKDSHVQYGKVGPLDEGFTWEHFDALLGQIKPGSKRSVKYTLITDPGVLGIGNGVLQDILFHAGLHPRHAVVDMDMVERRALYDAVRSVLSDMVAQGGRNSERDLFNRVGGYQRILHSKTAGQPCPECGTAIEKQSYLGGSVYFCPRCQVKSRA